MEAAGEEDSSHTLTATAEVMDIHILDMDTHILVFNFMDVAEV